MKEQGNKQCGHLGKSQRDWPIQASTKRWEGALCERSLMEKSTYTGLGGDFLEGVTLKFFLTTEQDWEQSPYA